MDELSELEQKFFETGELPPELAAEQPSEPQIEVKQEAPQEAASAEPPAVELEPQAPAQDDAMRQLVEAERSARLAEAQARRQLEAQLGELQKQLRELQRQPEPQVPDQETDPLGYTAAQIQKLTQQMEALQNRHLQQDQLTIQQQQTQQFYQHVGSLKEQFIKDHTDYADAYAHIRNIRLQDLKDFGLPPDQIEAVLIREEINLANAALQAGKNPAAVLYDAAKRYGYKPAQPPATPTPPAQKLEALKKGLEAGGKQIPKAATTDIPTLDSIKEMGDDDLSKVVTSDEMWNKIVGGNPGGSSIF